MRAPSRTTVSITMHTGDTLITAETHSDFEDCCKVSVDSITGDTNDIETLSCLDLNQAAALIHTIKAWANAAGLGRRLERALAGQDKEDS